MAEPAASGRKESAGSRWLLNLSLINKTRLGLSLIMLAFLTACLAFVWMQRREQEARDWTVHTYEVLFVAGQIDSGLMRMRHLLRDGLLTSNPARLQDFQDERRQFDDALLSIDVLTHDNPGQQARLARVNQELALWTTVFVDPALELLRALEPGEQLRERQGVLDLLSLGANHIAALQQLLSDIEQDERVLLEQRMLTLKRNNSLGKVTMGVVFLVGLLATLWALTLVRRSVAEPLGRLTGLLDPIASGDYKDPIPYQWRSDEVGLFAQALNKLNQLVRQRRDENWVKTHLARLTGELQLADQHESFGDSLLRLFCEWSGAGYAVAYRWNDDTHRLEACAGYGVAASAWKRTSFEEGEGPVGQCMREQKIILLSPVPAAHFEIVSGLGAGMPDSLLFAPLVSRGEVVGVIELASLGGFAPLVQQLLGEALNPTALAWQTLGRSLRTRELLDVTQTQAEELQASEEALRIQQEQLQSTNEALRTRSTQLEEQGQRLQASEEELRAQAEELRIANEALRERSESLIQRQGELESARGELEKRAEELERASRYKSEFLANMSHELRTPLNSMLILSKSLADNDDGNLLPEQIESASIVHDSGRNLLQLINDILDLSKVEAGRMQVLPEDVVLADFAAMEERNFAPVARTRNLELKIELDPALPPTIRTDGTRLGQIITNLLSNAFKFTSEGGVTLRISPAPVERLNLSGLKPGHAVLFSVIDTGIGIAQDKLEQVFRPFEQADSSTSRRYGGTGLGLSIVRGMAGLLGGDVFAESEPGKGSTFMLVLPDVLDIAGGDVALHTPVAPKAVVPVASSAASVAMPVSQAPAASAPAAQAPPQSDKPPVLLVVEDDAAFSNILTALAGRKQLPVEVAASGAEALRIAAERPLLGVLLDLGLPDMSGWSVLETLKQQPATANVPVHIISAADEAERGRNSGAVGFLTKPVTREAVLEAMQGLIDFGSALPRGARQVLLVDDNAGARKAVRKLLEHEPAEIYEAASGAEAEAALRERHYDCMILDLGLPDISGFDLLDKLSAQGPLPPVVIYSGRDLGDEENLRLRQYTESIVIKGARSPERLLDEVSLFLHALGRKDAATAASVADVQKDVAGKKLLIVDDDMRNIFALSKALRTRKLDVTMAQDGYKALAQLDANPEVDLVLMDIMMPGMDGYETIRKIREQPRFARLPIIAVTAKAMTGDREKCIEAGASDYCSKPIDVEKLMSQIRVWI
ncbi:hybrid sensor histidine kinase/response regulator [Hydrocarboniphaga effusa]|jgi:CheY-like chemotaxis protein/CHASE3 domain sensor protein|uniref:hybrid sensor histidine kinase/response regulator n=1 Tax=Hydrocarboniphaga effusa TaxID=243629 RepID=UPI0035AF6D15